MAGTVAMSPIVDVLCVTKRPGCRSWLRWNVQRQTYPRLRVVLVDATGDGGEVYTPEPFVWTRDPFEELRSRSGVAMLAPEDYTCGQLRNLALAAAEGAYVVWFDDDDWYHPERVQWLVDALEGTDEPWAGWGCGYYMHLASRMGGFLPPRAPFVINGGAIYRTEIAQSVAYDDVPAGSDRRWIHALASRFGTNGLVLRDERLHAIWMQHVGNTSPTLRGAPGPLGETDFAARAEGWWGTTSRRLEVLEAALRGRP